MAEAQRYRIGYAFQPKKVKTFILPSLLRHANEKGIDLVPIDPTTPLIQQAPFHCIIHKLYSRDWNQQLTEFSTQYPNSHIIEPPQKIEPLHNRISMLEAVTRIRIGIPQDKYTIGIPKQKVVISVEEFDLKFPVIAKPLVADGGATSHDMLLVLNSKGLENVIVKKERRTGIVVQEFVNHGGVVFKVYVVGNHVECVKRRSLPDISEDHHSISSDGVLPFSQISAAVAVESDSENMDDAEMPDSVLLEEMATALRLELGIRLFNFDVIRETNNKNKYAVIDINYFPGYPKIPNYEQVLTDFFLDLLTH